MKKGINKLIFSKTNIRDENSSSVIAKRIKNIKSIWNNEHHDDVGIEKIFRLFLAASQFLFPGIYIKHFFRKSGSSVQDVAMDLYIIIKVVFPLILLYNHWQNNTVALVFVLWFLFETLLYVPTLIFASDHFSKPGSYRRSILLLFFNYFEIAFAFSYLYSTGNYLNIPFKNWYDAIYFSITTFATIGFGEYFPITGTGKFLSCCQAIIFLAFVVLFINFFSDKIKPKGYFEDENKN